MGGIQVTALSKAYKQYSSPWARLVEWLSPASRARHSLKWILQDIHFNIAPGEAVGIIGVNGAGKSTLLKLITGTAQASSGSIAVQGRVAALLELGMGFHPDFSGRQNVLMAGQLLGYTLAEIEAQMAAIEAFAEIGAAIDEPVRIYSSGMQMRLAFSVATCIRPDILIVDEALAVGDVFFQQKCFDRIKQFTAAGTTLLFVSHSAGTVLNICSRCLFLRQGKLVFDGAPKDALDLYQAELLQRLDQTPAQIQVNREPGAKTKIARIAADAPALEGKTGSITSDACDCIAVRFFADDGEQLQTIEADQNVTLQIDYRMRRACDDPHIGFKIRNRYGVVLFETNSYCMRQNLGAVSAGSILSVRFRFPLALMPDEYTITVGVGNGGYDAGSFREVLSYLHEVRHFTVVRNPAAITWDGLINLAPQLQVEKRDAGMADPR